jgi:hypothetical protein
MDQVGSNVKLPRGSTIRSGGARRMSSRRSTVNTVGGLNTMRRTSRRESVHSNMSAGFSKNIKRNFYGLKDEESVFQEFWNTYQGGLASAVVIFFYYLIGTIFYHNEEGWDVITCLYFETMTLTTVGYGDVSPTTNKSRTFTVFYILCGIAIVGRIINDFAVSILEFVEKRAKEKMKDNKHVGSQPSIFYWKKIATSTLLIIFVVIFGALFYHKNEDIGFGEAVYFCVVTSSTVGYGDTTLTKDSSRMFAIFYMMSSCIIVAVSIGNAAAVFLEMNNDKKREEMLSRKLDFNFIRELDKGDDVQGIDKLNFLVAMLVHLELVDRSRDIDPWLTKFEELDINGDGHLDFNEAIENLEKAEQIRVKEINDEIQAVKNVSANLLGNMFNINNLISPNKSSPDKNSSDIEMPRINYENDDGDNDNSDNDDEEEEEEEEENDGYGRNIGITTQHNPMRL